MRTNKPAICALVLVTALLALPVSAGAASKVGRCQDLEISVDRKAGGGDWQNGFAKLALLEQGQGWQVKEPAEQKGKSLAVAAGSELRFTFLSGTHPVDVTPSTGEGHAIAIEEQRQPHIVRVQAKKATDGARLSFEIVGAKSAKADTESCSQGSITIVVE